MSYTARNSYGDVEVLGVYQVPFSVGLAREAWKHRKGGGTFAGILRTIDLAMKVQDMRTAVLVEVVVNDPMRMFDMAQFGQTDFDQVPFDEAYLALDGESVL